MRRMLYIFNQSSLQICLLIIATVFLPKISDAEVFAPTLKWSYGGCVSIYCDTGWYSSPGLIDLDGDGRNEVVASGYSITALDGISGALIWRAYSGHQVGAVGTVNNVGRTWPGIAIADVDGTGAPEIVTAHGGGVVSVYDTTGHFKAGWPYHVTGGQELRSLSVADLDGNGLAEVIIGRATSNAINTWVLNSNGAVRAGWPQPTSNANGYSWGVYNSNIAVANIRDNNALEIIVPSDVHYICAYDLTGTPLPVNWMYTTGTVWGRIGAYVDIAYELQGYGPCDPPHGASRANFADGPASIGDLNGDGVLEIVVMGNVYDCGTDNYQSLYNSPYIFNADRSRFKDGLYDWTTPPMNTGAPLTQDYDVIETAEANAALADLDGDGKMEIIFSSYDGRVHAFWLDKTEHHSWPFEVYNSAEGFYRFASEPVVVDLDGDGTGEVLFTSWTQKGSNQTGDLYIVDWQGNQLQKVPLPAVPADADWNGALPAPTVGNFDNDPDLEVVVLTAQTGAVAYDLPGTARGRILWGTGRGNFGRTGLAMPEPVKNDARSWKKWQ